VKKFNKAKLLKNLNICIRNEKEDSKIKSMKSLNRGIFFCLTSKKNNMKNTQTYHELVQKMREFFLSKNFKEVPVQSRLSILAACENPHSVKTFEYCGEQWPLP